MAKMTDADLARLRAAVQFRDACVKAALRDYARFGVDGRDVHARSAFDSMSPLIEARVRTQVVAEIADELAKIATDEAQRPNRDAVSKAIETWMVAASAIARQHAAAKENTQP